VQLARRSALGAAHAVTERVLCRVIDPLAPALRKALLGGVEQLGGDEGLMQAVEDAPEVADAPDVDGVCQHAPHAGAIKISRSGDLLDGCSVPEALEDRDESRGV